MSNQLPSIQRIYSDNEMAALQHAQQTAARFGVEPKFLQFASLASVSDPQEEYIMHNYSTIHIGNKTVHYDEQLTNALTLLDSGHLWCDPPSIIVINAPEHLFGDTAKEPFRGPIGFLSHLICSLAHRVSTRKAPAVTVNFMDPAGVDHSKGYTIKPRHLLIWGPVTDHFHAFDYNKTIQFLYQFRTHTRILQTSTKDMGALLDNLRIDVDHVAYFFNFAAEKGERKGERTKLEKQIEIVTEAKAKKKRTRKKKEEEETPTTISCG